MLKREKGFTLIELMIVVAIIGILAAIAIPKFVELLCKSKDSAGAGDLGAVRSAIVLYYGQYEQYPNQGAGNSLSDLTTARILKVIPEAKTGKFETGDDDVVNGYVGNGGWWYDTNWGTAYLDMSTQNCVGTKAYTAY